MIRREPVHDLYKSLSPDEKDMIQKICAPKRRRNSLKIKLGSLTKCLMKDTFSGTANHRRKDQIVRKTLFEGDPNASIDDCEHTQTSTEVGEEMVENKHMVIKSFGMTSSHDLRKMEKASSGRYKAIPCDDKCLDCKCGVIHVSSRVEHSSIRRLSLSECESIEGPSKVFRRMSLSSMSSLGPISFASRILIPENLVPETNIMERCLQILSENGSDHSRKTYGTLQKLLADVMRDEGNSRDILCALNGVDTICSFISKCQDASLTELAVKILGFLAEDNHERQEILGKKRAVSHILSCIRRFSSIEEKLLNQESLIALYHLTQLYDNTLLFISDRGIPLLMNTMLVFKSNLVVQKYAFGILLHIVQVQHAHLYLEQNFVFILTSTIQHHHASQHLQKLGCILLRELIKFSSQDKHINSDIVGANVAAFIIASMKAHPHHQDIVRHGFAACYTLCQATEGVNQVMVQEMVLCSENFVPILKIIRFHQSSVGVQREAFKLLRCLRTFKPSNFGHLTDTILSDSVYGNILIRAGLSSQVQLLRRCSNVTSICTNDLEANSA